MIDFPAIAREFHIPIRTSGHHHCTTGWVQTHCPFCSAGKSGWRLGWNVKQGNFACWKCGGVRTWDVLSLLLPPTATIRRVWHDFQIQDGPYTTLIKKTPVSRPKSPWKPNDLKPLQPIHRKYLRRRGFTPSQLSRQWGVLGTGALANNGWTWRVVFPIFNNAGHPVAYAGRAAHPDIRPKYKMPKNDQMTDPPDTLLYGIDKAVDDFVVIVEGPTDVWRLGPGAVALLGIKWKAPQIKLLAQYPKRFVLLDNNETKAQQQAESLAQSLALYPGQTEIITGIDTDPGDMSPADAKTLMEELHNGRGTL